MEKRRKKDEKVERWKTEAIAAKRWRAKERISLFSEKKMNYESNTGDEMDPDQVSDEKNPLQLWEKKASGRYEWLK